MGHRQKMTDKQRLDWDVMQYKARRDAMRGHHYPYWDDEKYKDWEIAKTTVSEYYALKLRDEMKLIHKKVKIVCGYEKTVQRVKHYTIIYK
jgi:hypothetical protein